MIAWLRAALRSRAQRRRLAEVERWARYWQARAMAREEERDWAQDEAEREEPATEDGGYD